MMKRALTAALTAGALLICLPAFAGEKEEGRGDRDCCYSPGMQMRGEPDMHMRGEPDMQMRGEPDMQMRGEPGMHMRGEPDMQMRGEPGMQMWGEPGMHMQGYGDWNKETRKFLDETVDLRRDIHARMFDYMEAGRRGDEEKSKALEDELFELRKKLDEKAGEMGLRRGYPGRGHGPGMMRH